jgi:cyclase
MPVAYGGGIRSVEDARTMLQLGVEKVVMNTAAVEDVTLVRNAAQEFGSQSVVVCMDVKRSFLGRYELYIHGGRKNTKLYPVTFAKRMEDTGAGEIIVNSIDRDGTMVGYDLELTHSITSVVRIPVIACGGAGKLDDFRCAVSEGGASAVAAGSLFVFHGKHRAVLINYPVQMIRGVFSAV